MLIWTEHVCCSAYVPGLICLLNSFSCTGASLQAPHWRFARALCDATINLCETDAAGSRRIPAAGSRLSLGLTVVSFRTHARPDQARTTSMPVCCLYLPQNTARASCWNTMSH